MQRQFTSGSRQAPDPFDQFLEENDYYRKHTARDASCLFRVISEQMYDTQLHHLTIRKKCVRYMRKHSDFFQPLVDRDLDEYLDDMSKPKTYGTLIELQAVGYVFERKVVLFEPFDLGKYYINSQHFSEVFRVFYTPERHFDSVFTCDYIKDAAICQSICYEILYKDLYQLPDVSFAVEQMLHSASFEGTECRSECNEDGYCTRIHMADGRSFELDLPQNTCCILENYKLCHFHYINFPRLSDDLQREMKVYSSYRGEGQEKNALNKTAESLLPDKFISCVRQLLQEGITPFPYKVAKALDPNMYRNIEFDSWNEARKELKLQNWYNGDTNFKVGAKCHVKLRKSENDLYTCHIQEIAVDKGYCIVFIEQLGEKRLVPYESLTPLPPDQFKPWTLPYRLQRHMQKYSSVRYTRHYNYRFKCNGQFSAHEYCSSGLPSIKSEYFDVGSDDEKHSYSAGGSQHHSSCYYKLKQYTHLENFRTQTVEYCAMPLTVDHGANRDHDSKIQRPTENTSRAPSRSSMVTADGHQIKQELEDVPANGTPLMDHYELDNGVYMPEMHFYPVHQYAGGGDDYYSYSFDGSMHPTALMPANGAGAIYYTCAPSYGAPPPPNNMYLQAAQAQPTHPLLTTAVGPNTANVHAGGFFPNSYFSAALVPPAPMTSLATTSQINTPVNTNNLTPSTRGSGRAISATTPLTGRINWEAKKSVKANGMDLPTDVATLRYFYNLGLDYHFKRQQRGGSCATEETSVVDAKEHIVKLSAEIQSMKLDENGNIPSINNKNDTNNNNNSNSVPNQNQNSSSGKPYQSSSHQRRFPSRYFNSKERQAYQQQRNGGGGSVNAGTGQHNRSNTHHQNDFNKHHVSGKITSAVNNSTPNGLSSRNQVRENSNAGANNGGNAGSNNSLQTVAELGIQTSPIVSYDGGSNSCNENAQTPTTIYNQSLNPFITYGAYDYTNDPNGQPSQFAPPPPAGGVFIQMPLAASAYGIYSAPPPPPNMGIHPSAGAYPPPYMGPPPPNAATATITPLHGPPHQPPTPHATLTASSTQQAVPNGFYAPSSGIETMESNGAVDGGGLHYQCMSYPPPMPFYYTPTNTGTMAAVGGGSVSTNTPNATVIQQQSHTAPVGAVGMVGPSPTSIGQQGYWCVQQASMAPVQPSTLTNGGTAAPSGNSIPTTCAHSVGILSTSGGSGTHNRRDKPTANE